MFAEFQIKDNINKQDRKIKQKIVEMKKCSPDFFMAFLVLSSFSIVIAYVKDNNDNVAHNNANVNANME